MTAVNQVPVAPTAIDAHAIHEHDELDSTSSTDAPADRRRARA
jgi:hypothetical protein